MSTFEIMKSFDKFIDQHSFYDRKEVYTDYRELIEVSKIREWLEDYIKELEGGD